MKEEIFNSKGKTADGKELDKSGFGINQRLAEKYGKNNTKEKNKKQLNEK